MRSRIHSLWLLVDHCVLRNWDRILVRAVKGLISRAGMVSICPLLWQRDVKLQQTNKWKPLKERDYFSKPQRLFTVRLTLTATCQGQRLRVEIIQRNSVKLFKEIVCDVLIFIFHKLNDITTMTYKIMKQIIWPWLLTLIWPWPWDWPLTLTIWRKQIV